MIDISLIEHGVLYILTGAFAGLMAGILGIGGGMIVVPALLFIYHHIHLVPLEIEMHVAAGTSLAIMVFTAQASVRAHLREHTILWPIFYCLWPGILIGTVGGALLAHVMSSHWLRIILGIVLLLIAVKMLLPSRETKKREMPATWVTRAYSVLVGLKSGLLGIGGGALLIPYLTFFGVKRRDTAAISALCTLIVSIVGAFAFMLLGYYVPGLPAYTTGYVYWPAVFWVALPSMFLAPIGAHLTYILPVAKLRYAFIAMLLIASFDILLRHL